MGSSGPTEQVEIARGPQFGLETKAVEVAGSYPGRTVQGPAAAVILATQRSAATTPQHLNSSQLYDLSASPKIL